MGEVWLRKLVVVVFLVLLIFVVNRKVIDDGGCHALFLLIEIHDWLSLHFNLHCQTREKEDKSRKSRWRPRREQQPKMGGKSLIKCRFSMSFPKPQKWWKFFSEKLLIFCSLFYVTRYEGYLVNINPWSREIYKYFDEQQTRASEKI